MATKNEIQRINNLVGQLNGIKTMIDNDKDCSSILIQLSAVKSAIDSLSNHIIENNFTKCIDDNKKSDELKKMIKLLIKNN